MRFYEGVLQQIYHSCGLFKFTFDGSPGMNVIHILFLIFIFITFFSNRKDDFHVLPLKSLRPNKVYL